jgi:hypothetical protein
VPQGRASAARADMVRENICMVEIGQALSID